MDWRKVSTLGVCTLALTACGAIYIPQQFDPAGGAYGYHRSDDVDIEVLPLTFRTAAQANADGYQPRGLPNVFAEADPVANISTRERIAAAGLDVVEPAVSFDPLPAPPGSYDPNSEILQPYIRSEDIAASVRAQQALRGTPGAPSSSSGINAELSPPAAAQQVRLSPPPAIEAQPYLIGPGDVIALLSELEPLDGGASGALPSILADATKRLLVQGNGEIYVPQVGAVDVGGLTLTEARREIFDRLLDSQLDTDFGIEIAEFGSQKVAVSGPQGSQLVPITVRPLRLAEAVVAAGGLGGDPSNTVVRVLRSGTIYEIPAAQLNRSSDLGSRVLIDGDVVSVAPVYDVEAALTYFDQQVKLREFQRAPFEDGLRRNADARANIAEQRAALQFEIEKERLRQEARVDNLAARQVYLDRLRELREANLSAARQAEVDRRNTLRFNAAERVREREERRDLLELELQEERLRIEQVAEQNNQARELFAERVRLGAVEQDYVTIAGETDRQTTFALPFAGKVTLNRVLYEEARGIDAITGDSSEIYVLRRAAAGTNVERIVAYHLDASNVAALSVATSFEMRPNDVVFVNPQPVTNWNRVVSQLLPSTNALSSAALAASRAGN